MADHLSSLAKTSRGNSRRNATVVLGVAHDVHGVQFLDTTSQHGLTQRPVRIVDNPMESRVVDSWARARACIGRVWDMRVRGTTLLGFAARIVRVPHYY